MTFQNEQELVQHFGLGSQPNPLEAGLDQIAGFVDLKVTCFRNVLRIETQAGRVTTLPLPVTEEAVTNALQLP